MTGHSGATRAQSSAEEHRREVLSGERFQFGRNWRKFLRQVDESRIQASEDALLTALGAPDLSGRAFLDIGCGSGLSALAAVRAGAQVTAFDFDPEAVAATTTLLERWAPEGSQWRVMQGSALDRTFVGGLGVHDIVHSWGVLHHTGSMWDACDIAAAAVPEGGMLFIALYNDAGAKSTTWRKRKRRYVRLPRGLRTAYAWSLLVAAEVLFLSRALRAGRPSDWYRRWRDDRPERGMDRYRDWIDWIGGYPYEFSTVEETVAFFATRGLTPTNVVPNGGTGCNEFVFERDES